MEALVALQGPGVGAYARRSGSNDGLLWILDGNEQDPWADAICELTHEALLSADVLTGSLSDIVAAIDRDVLPSAASKHGVPGFALSLLIGRLTGDWVTIAHVGEARAHVLDADGEMRLVTKDHNAFVMYPEAIWRDQYGYSEHEAKQTILNVAGGGVAKIESHTLPREPHGALILSSHRWHGYAEVGSYLTDLRHLGSADEVSRMAAGEALAVLRW